MGDCLKKVTAAIITKYCLFLISKRKKMIHYQKSKKSIYYQRKRGFSLCREDTTTPQPTYFSLFSARVLQFYMIKIFDSIFISKPISCILNFLFSPVRIFSTKLLNSSLSRVDLTKASKIMLFDIK